MPPQDKYKLVRLQQKEPAFGRQKKQFIAEGDNYTKTMFRPMPKVDEAEQAASNGNNSLFPN